MAEGRGSAVIWLMGMVAFAFAMQSTATEYIVGGNQGWGFGSYTSWLSTRQFKAGDVLVFRYVKATHNVISVDEDGYRRCKVTGTGYQVYTSGDDKITLKKGINYFICGIAGHCAAGMKISVFAS